MGILDPISVNISPLRSHGQWHKQVERHTHV